MNFSELLDSAPNNLTIADAIGKCWQQINNHDEIIVSVSGGSDSDIMMDLIIRCGGKDKATFIFFNTGLEYAATRRQIQTLNEKYGVEIQVVPPVKPIPLCIHEHGVPFWSKYVSEMISRLQSHGFQWEDEPLEVLTKKYPHCKSALQWWCNDHPRRDGRVSSFDIDYIRGLKQFLVKNPPNFKISNRCCHYAKKLPAKRFMKSSTCDLNCVGIRKAEGGVRADRYKNCYTQSLAGPDQYRPLFWFTDDDKAEYDKHYGITHSDCYKVWGMTRTGCAGCPFSKDYKEELAIAEKYEPKFYKAMLKLFGPSYEYRRQFEAFREGMKNKESDSNEQGDNSSE